MREKENKTPQRSLHLVKNERYITEKGRVFKCRKLDKSRKGEIK